MGIQSPKRGDDHPLIRPCFNDKECTSLRHRKSMRPFCHFETVNKTSLAISTCEFIHAWICFAMQVSVNKMRGCFLFSFSGVSVSMIVLSIIVLCVESEFYFVTVSANSSSLSPSSDSSAVVSSNVSLGHQKEIIPVKRRRTHRHSSTLFLVESLAMTWFSIEFITRSLQVPYEKTIFF